MMTTQRLSPLTVDFTVKVEAATRRQGERRLTLGGGSGLVQSRAGFGWVNTGWEEGGREGIRWRGQKTGEEACPQGTLS